MNRAIFLDRDGTINEIVSFPELGLLESPMNPEQFSLLPGAAKAISILNRLGLKVVVASNQPSVAKGKMTEEVFERVRAKMRKELAENGAHVDAEYYCFHHPSAKHAGYRVDCECRKPKPGLLLKAARDLDVNLSESYIVGDSLTDIKAGKAVGCRTLLIGSLKCDLCRLMEDERVKPDLIVPNMLAAAKTIEKEMNNNVKPSFEFAHVLDRARYHSELAW